MTKQEYDERMLALQEERNTIMVKISANSTATKTCLVKLKDKKRREMEEVQNRYEESVATVKVESEKYRLDTERQLADIKRQERDLRYQMFTVKQGKEGAA